MKLTSTTFLTNADSNLIHIPMKKNNLEIYFNSCILIKTVSL